MEFVASFARFAVVGAAATAIHATVFALLVEATPVDPVAATAIAFVVAFACGFALNRRWTFDSRADPLAQLPRYLAAQLVGLGLNAAIMAAVVHGFGASPYLGLALAIAIVPPVTYALARTWVFRPDTAPTDLDRRADR